ncbi:putative ATP-grasp-modified RiPP [Streptomyces sp. NPDC056500]|uniref:putative ATP-grasp-modified RiPP n=1 Tax=Streptomyces sp. NPDC056500 TaxID=3345840 RepID=UPI00369B3FC8
MTTVAHPVREAFPLVDKSAREGSSQSPSGPSTRPWVMRFAATPDRRNLTAVPQTRYDEMKQVSVTLDGSELLPCMATEKKTVPDGDMKNPPPPDQGPQD